MTAKVRRAEKQCNGTMGTLVKDPKTGNTGWQRTDPVRV